MKLLLQYLLSERQVSIDIKRFDPLVADYCIVNKTTTNAIPAMEPGVEAASVAFVAETPTEASSAPSWVAPVLVLAVPIVPMLEAPVLVLAAPIVVVVQVPSNEVVAALLLEVVVVAPVVDMLVEVPSVAMPVEEDCDVALNNEGDISTGVEAKQRGNSRLYLQWHQQAASTVARR